MLTIYFWAIFRYIRMGKANFKFSALDPWVSFFLLIILVALARGLISGYELRDILTDFSLLLGYVAYYLSRVIKNPRDFLKKLFIVLMIVGTLIGIMYLAVLLYYPVFRVATRQANMALVSYIIALNGLIIAWKSRLFRIFLLVVMGFSLAAIGISLQRALWVVTPLATFLVFFVWGYKGYLSRRLTLSLIGGLLLSLIPFYFLLYRSSLFWYGMILLERASSLTGSVEVIPSLKLRVLQHYLVLERIGNLFFFGSGLGDKMWLSFSQIYTSFVDNSIECYLWKTGVVGAAIFLLLMFKSLWMGWKVTIHSRDRVIEWFSASFFISLLSLFLASFTTSFFFAYRFIFIFALFLGFLSHEYDKIRTGEGNT